MKLNEFIEFYSGLMDTYNYSIQTVLEMDVEDLIVLYHKYDSEYDN